MAALTRESMPKWQRTRCYRMAQWGMWVLRGTLLLSPGQSGVPRKVSPCGKDEVWSQSVSESEPSQNVEEPVYTFKAMAASTTM